MDVPIGSRHSEGDALTEARDALEEGDAAGVMEAYGRDEVDATITDLVRIVQRACQDEGDE